MSFKRFNGHYSCAAIMNKLTCSKTVMTQCVEQGAPPAPPVVEPPFPILPLSFKKMVALMPKSRQCRISGRISFVKIYGAEERPKGRTVNM